MAWQACHALVLAVYRETARWPRREEYGLTAQIRRASTSSTINIAEGSAKQSLAEFKRFLDIALGSLAEVSCLLELAKDLNILAKPDYCELEVLRGPRRQADLGPLQVPNEEGRFMTPS
jgi:four helix bundle protein